MQSSWDLGRKSVIAQLRGGAGTLERSIAALSPGSEKGPKYHIEGEIGRGGMGEVLLVTDHDLHRQVAMKVLLPEAADDPASRLHFVAEAQAASQLEHPGIPPVHDIGIASDGRVYFTMKLVRGRTLAEILHDLFLKRPDVWREWSIHRLTTVIERLCETLHFAHERGVIHRDVKPQNVMLGDFGEVHLMDWGIARVEGADADTEVPTTEFVRTARTDLGDKTEYGSVKGTLPYMAPEQLTGVTDRRADVYAIGCLLYEVLTLQPAFAPGTKGLVARVAAGEYPPIESRNAPRTIPEALATICMKAMAKAPEERFPTAREMGAALRSWLDGTSDRERRHREAEAFAAKGLAAVNGYERTKAEVLEAEEAAAAQATTFHPWQPVAEKRPLLDARKQVESARSNVALAFAEALKWFDAALAQEEKNVTARQALASLWKGRLDEAEAKGEGADAAYALEMIRRFDDGKLAAYVQGDGKLELLSEPTGAEATIYRHVERDGVLVASDERALGKTPLEAPLAMGSYLVILKRAGFDDVRYPVHIARNRTWEGRVRMRTIEEVGKGFVYVPGGPFVYGEGKTTKVVELDDFAIARYPVTFGEYGEYLAALEKEGGGAAASQRIPANQSGDKPYMVRRDDGTYAVREDIIEGTPAERALKAHGPDWRSKVPVLAVSFDDAAAYCAWKCRSTGRAWRLPTEEEREKAARGVDGRRFPWGDLEDATLGKCRESRPENPQPEPIGSFPTAASVYGMGDAAGNLWDWTDSWFDARRSSRVLRGGSWTLAPIGLRAAYRNALSPSFRYADGGFRCARGL